ncbi:hypothetical protein SK128_022402 [Halocaridina rubra]|uniref:Uncharacterized protein n=1 Tax=Halocaridina rubra TaxID=373956 RepID=A0AAN8WKN5_HALRR
MKFWISYSHKSKANVMKLYVDANSCVKKQADVEPFSDFYERLKNLAEDVDLISMDTRASVEDTVNCCHSNKCQTKKDIPHRASAKDIERSLQLPTPLQLQVDPDSFVHIGMAQGSAPLLRAPLTIANALVIGPTPPTLPSAAFVARQDTMTSAAK